MVRNQHRTRTRKDSTKLAVCADMTGSRPVPKKKTLRTAEKHFEFFNIEILSSADPAGGEDLG